MKKFYSLKKVGMLAIAAIVSLSAAADVLSPEQALSRAAQNASRSALKAASKKQSLVYTEKANNLPAVYVFSAGEGQGFTIASADESAVALLGYADEGSFDPNNIPEALKGWLEGLADQVAFARAHNYSATSFKAESTKPAVEPLLTSLWDQSGPYNLYTPVVQYKTSSTADYKDYQSPTGCVATAMAQVMYYHKWPKSAGVGSIAFTPKAGTREVQLDELSMDFSEVVFDWDNMKDTYTGTETESDPSAAAVALLMKACGYSVSMGYGHSSSGATSHKIGTALIENWGYDKGLSYRQRDYYREQEWADLIYNQLSQKLPVYYKGTNTTGGGHAFVCDGYKDGLFHFNWGWGGTSNGYFLLSGLDPYVQGIGGSNEGYNYTQAAVIDIKPDAGSTVSPWNIIMENFFVSTTSAQLGGTFSVPDGRWESYCYTLSTGKYYAKMQSTTNENLVYYAAGNHSPVDQKVSYGWTGGTFTLPNAMQAGEYIVTPVFDLNNAGTYYDIPVKYNSNRAVKAVVEGTTVTFENIATPKLQATNFTIGENVVIYIDTDAKSSGARTKNVPMNFTLTNNGDDYNGGLYVELVNEEGVLQDITDRQIISLKAGESVDFSYSGKFSSAPAGEYYAVVVIPNPDPAVEYTEISERIPVTVVNPPATSTTGYYWYVWNNYDTFNIVMTHEDGTEYDKKFLGTADQTKYFEFKDVDPSDLYVDFTIYNASKSSTGNKAIMAYSDYFNLYLYEYTKFTTEGNFTRGNSVTHSQTGQKYIAVDERIRFHEKFLIDPYTIEYNHPYAFCLTWRSNDGTTGWTYSSTSSMRALRFADPTTTAINNVSVDGGEVVKTEVFNTSGVKVAEENATPGVYVRVKTLSNGKTQTEKVVIR